MAYEHLPGVTTFTGSIGTSGVKVIAETVRMMEGVWITNHDSGTTNDMFWGQASGSEDVLLPRRGAGVSNGYFFIPIKRGPLWVKATDVGPADVSGFYA